MQQIFSGTKFANTKKMILFVKKTNTLKKKSYLCGQIEISIAKNQSTNIIN